jgi:ABC-type cobalamin/Fe3+-siderophores transport system ATPase subunit
MIEFRGVAVRYPNAERDALSGVSFSAERGVITAVVGPNGSGKSTVVRTLIGRIGLSRGTIRLDGESTRDVPRPVRARRIAFVTQREELAFPVLVDEYAALGRFPHLGLWRAADRDDRRAVDRALDEAGVTSLRARRLDELSGGEWQRVRLARALAQGGDALVLDEPTAFLDVAHEMSVFELLDRLAQNGRAVLLVSHQLNLVARFAATLVLLRDGSVVATGTPDQVMQAPILERVYDWPLVVTHDPLVGAPALVPLRARPAE